YNSRLGNMINDSNGIKGEMPFIAVNNTQVRYHPLYSSFLNTNSSITAGINSEPRLVENGAVVLNEPALDPGERTAKTTRVGIGLKEDTVYIVAAHSATIPDLAAVMQAMGLDYAMALDVGSSTGMYYDGEYKVGPGRNVPNAIIFKR